MNAFHRLSVKWPAKKDERVVSMAAIRAVVDEVHNETYFVNNHGREVYPPVQDEPGEISTLKAFRENVLTNIHEAVMELQSMGHQEPSGYTKGRISNFETELMAIYRNFSTFCSDQEAQIQEDLASQVAAERELEQMRRDRL